MNFITLAVFMTQALSATASVENILHIKGAELAVGQITTTTSSGTAVAAPEITLPPRQVASMNPARNNSGCSTVSSILQSCEIASPGLTSSAISRQAACYCYSSSSWAPSQFDDGVRTCADYLSTQSTQTEAYSAFSVLEGFCTSQGDIRSPATTTNGGTLPPPTATTTPPSNAASLAMPVSQVLSLAPLILAFAVFV